MIYQGKAGHPVLQSMLHCLAITAAQSFKTPSSEWVGIVREWHLARGWADIGYHYVVSRDGHIWAGRPLNQFGAGAIGHNRGVLHIAMVEKGNIQNFANFSDQFTPAQKQAVRAINHKHGIASCRGHNDVAHKLCPGFKVRAVDFVGWPIFLPGYVWHE